MLCLIGLLITVAFAIGQNYRFDFRSATLQEVRIYSGLSLGINVMIILFTAGR